MKALSLGLCVALAACGGTISGDDGGATDAASDGTTKNDGGGGPDSGNTCTCAMGLVCCDGACVNTNNDPHNCGACGIACNTASDMCLGGGCTASQCNPTCTAGSICCEIDGPGPSGPPQCEQGNSCPVGCPLCN